MQFYARSIIALLLLFTTAAQAADDDTIVFSTAPTHSKDETIKLYTPLMNYLSQVTGKKFVIEAINNSPENIYIQSATLNGQPLDRAWITHEELISGGTLRLVMGATPSHWGSDKNKRPPSVSHGAFPDAVRWAR